MSINDNVNHVKATLTPFSGITLIAASKYVDASGIQALFDAGVTHIGENRVEAFLEKKAQLSHLPITWHFIGTLQSKKVKHVINEIDVLHSLDRLRLAEEIEKHRRDPLPCFIEVNASEEPSKHGLALDDVEAFVDALAPLKKIHVIGLMTLAQATEDETLLRETFKKLRAIKDNIEQKQLSYAPCHYLSMGMSNDYLIASEEGATHIRLGSILFKEEM